MCVFVFTIWKRDIPLLVWEQEARAAYIAATLIFDLGFSSAVRSSSTPNLSSSEALGSSDVNSDSLR